MSVDWASVGAGLSGERPIALVTGGAVRVGRAICLELAARGLDVVLTYRSSEREALGVAAEVPARGGAAVAAPLDLEDAGEVERAAAGLAASLLRLDVLVHNASVYDASGVEGMDLALAERQWRVNAMSPLVLSAGLAGLLGESDLPGGGAIVAMLDIHAEGVPRAGYAAYAMSKAGLSAMVRSLAVDLGPRVRVNGVAPGVVAWPESGPDADAGMQERYLARVPLGRAGTPEDAAGAVAFLALDAGYTTGHVLTVDGGRRLR